MKKMMILFLIVSTGCHAAEIPLIDLTGPTLQHRETSNSAVQEDMMYSGEDESDTANQKATVAPDIQLRADAQTKEKPTAQQQAAPQQQDQAPQAGDHQQAQYGVNQGRRLRLFLRELTILQHAAKKAGGDIRVTIEPVGITPEELIGPLAASNWFDIKYGQDAIVVKSKEQDPYVDKMRDEVAHLEQQRKTLLNDVQSLERLASEWRSRVPTHQASSLPQDQQAQQPSSMQMSYPKTMISQQQQQLPLQQQPGYQPTPKTVIVNPEYAQQMMQGYDGQRVVVPQQRPPMAEQSVPRTSIPMARELPASAPISSNPQNQNNHYNENFNPNAAAMGIQQRYPSVAQQGQMYQQQILNGTSQPQYSSESTVVLAPRGK